MDLYPENVVEAVEGVCQGAVDIEPPVAGEVLLVVEGAHWAEPGEAGLGYGMGAVMVDLALSLRIGVVARREALAGE